MLPILDTITANVKKYADIAAIGVSGETLAFIVRDINAYLEMIVLLITIGGILWRTIRNKNENENEK